MDKYAKKDLAYLVLAILAGVGILLSELLPTLSLSGPWLIFIVLVSGAVGKYLEKTIKRSAGIPVDEETPESGS